MRFDFSQIQDVESFVSVPEGTYLCRVAEVRDGLTRDGNVRWSMRLEVAQGEYAGRTAGWDGLHWSERGIVRVKRVLEALGVDVRGEIELEPRDLLGAVARVEFRAEQWNDPTSGRQVMRLSVPYGGYARADSDAGVRTGPEAYRGPDSDGEDEHEIFEAPSERGGGGARTLSSGDAGHGDAAELDARPGPGRGTGAEPNRVADTARESEPGRESEGARPPGEHAAGGAGAAPRQGIARWIGDPD